MNIPFVTQSDASLVQLTIRSSTVCIVLALVSQYSITSHIVSRKTSPAIICPVP
jgi:hypothetical protein